MRDGKHSNLSKFPEDSALTVYIHGCLKYENYVKIMKMREIHQT